MIITTTEKIAGREYDTIGYVSGSTVQTVNAIRDIGASFRNLVGGEVKKYNEMMENARNLAIQRMVDQATSCGADAIVSVRFSSSEIMQGAAEVLAYGTAVKLK